MLRCNLNVKTWRSTHLFEDVHAWKTSVLQYTGQFKSVTFWKHPVFIKQFCLFWYLAPKTLLKIKGKITTSALHFKLLTPIFRCSQLKHINYWKKLVIVCWVEELTLDSNKTSVFRVHWYFYDSYFAFAFVLHANIIICCQFVSCTWDVLNSEFLSDN